MVEKHFNIIIVSVRSRGESLVIDNDRSSWRTLGGPMSSSGRLLTEMMMIILGLAFAIVEEVNTKTYDTGVGNKLISTNERTKTIRNISSDK
jgi:hypothetical protein